MKLHGEMGINYILFQVVHKRREHFRELRFKFVKCNNSNSKEEPIV